MNLVSFLFEVTARCNHDCRFCYNVWKENPAYPQGELDLERIKSLFDAVLPGLPTRSINLGGGEPLLRNDLEDIVGYFASRKFAVSVSTNGYFLNEVRAAKLVKAGVKQFEITLLSAQQKVHNTLCANPDSYDKACQAILNAKKLKVKTVLAFVATKENIGDISEVMDLGFALGANALAFYRFVPTGRGLCNKAELTPSSAQLNSALEVLDRKSKEYKLPVNMGIPIEPCQLKNKLKNIKMTFCQAGLAKFTIDYLGNLRVCEQSPEILGNLFQASFLSLALNKKVKDFRMSIKQKCMPCKYKRACRGGCKFIDRM